MRILLKITGLALFLLVMTTSNLSWATSLSIGIPIIAIDGNGDSNVTVDIGSYNGSSSYTYGYFLNGSATFTPLTPNFGPFNISTFQGGDVLDLALYDGAKYYTLSGDETDNTYSVTMGFDNPVTGGAPQQPSNWTAPYYYNVNISWSLPTAVNTNELALNFSGGNNDGVAPVPEPASLLLLGSGLLGLGIAGWKKGFNV